jgi:hypothetical protein
MVDCRRRLDRICVRPSTNFGPDFAKMRPAPSAATASAYRGSALAKAPAVSRHRWVWAQQPVTDSPCEWPGGGEGTRIRSSMADSLVPLAGTAPAAAPVRAGTAHSSRAGTTPPVRATPPNLANQAGQSSGPTKRGNQAGQPSRPTKLANQAGQPSWPVCKVISTVIST